jgi:hypothetical protein
MTTPWVFVDCEARGTGPVDGVLVVKTSQQVVLGHAQPLAEPVEERPAARGRHDPPGPASR